MAEQVWTDRAVVAVAGIARRNDHNGRGVMTSPELPNTPILFAPHAELNRITDELNEHGIEILGTGHSVGSGGDIFAMFVRTTDDALLRQIIG